ncbi:hypothetical protein V8D89_009426 [Ganoderma adspersum]
MPSQRPGIQDLPAEVLFLVFWCLHGQDIARCMRVSRCFADLIDSDVYLQYRIELARNGMVDGLASTLPVSERLQRLRQYSANFRNDIFDFEDPTAHPDYLHQLRNLQWSSGTQTAGVTSVLYDINNPVTFKSCLSVFTDGSVQAEIPSRRWIMPIGTQGDQTRDMYYWVIDRAQDLLVTIERVTMHTDSWCVSHFTPIFVLSCTHRNTSSFFEVRFCSWIGSQPTPMDHPAATLPCIQVLPPPGHSTDPAHQLHIYSLIVGGSYVTWKLDAVIDQAHDYSIHVCNWRTGQMISRIDLGATEMMIVLLDDVYILALSRNYGSDMEPHLTVYDLSPSIPNRAVCALQLPTLDLKAGEHIINRGMSTSQHPPVPEGHFRADPSISMVVIAHQVEGQERQDYASYLLIPYAALLAQIRTVADSSGLASHDSDPPVLVAWTDWGAHACLRLRVPPKHRFDYIFLVPYGSQMPILGFDDPERTRASVYVFDVNPLAARHALHTARAAHSALPVESGGGPGPTQLGTGTAVVEDVEAALPGVVDPECAAIPFVMYRFPLPPPPLEGRASGATASRIRAVRMSMTGFTVTVSLRLPHCVFLFEFGFPAREDMQLTDSCIASGRVGSCSSRLIIEWLLTHYQVCRYFADLIRSDAYLQYKIELAQNGMVDGDFSTLLVSERRQRLCQYSFNFRNGIFDDETPDAAHPDYAHQLRNLAWNHARRAYTSASALYGTYHGLNFSLSIFNHGSTQAGIRSHRWLMPIGTPGDMQTRRIKSWAIDRAQDLLVIIEQVTTDMNTRRFLEVHFWSLSGSKTTRMDHPATAQSSIQLFPPSGSDPTAKIDRIEFGTSLVNVVLWGDSHLLVQPTDSESPRRLDIYSLIRSSTNRPLRTLQLPEPTLSAGETVVFHPMQTSSDPSPPEGHFHADPTHSMVILTYHIKHSNRDEYASHLLIPYSTIRAQIDAAATQAVLDSPDSDSDLPPAPVPWQDWGPQGCLRLRVGPERTRMHPTLSIPSGSRMPVVASDGPSMFVYTIDINPLVARHARARSQTGDSEWRASAIVEDVEAALPGVVDPGCAGVPYVVYRFRLPFFPWEYHIRAVRMSMTGFTVTVSVLLGLQLARTQTKSRV